MPMDALCLSAVLRETEGAVVGGRIDKIHQPSRDEILLHIRGQGAPAGCCCQPTPAGPGSSSPPCPGRTPPSPPCSACSCESTWQGGRFWPSASPPWSAWRSWSSRGPTRWGQGPPAPHPGGHGPADQPHPPGWGGPDRGLPPPRRRGPDPGPPPAAGMFYQYPEAQAGKLDPRTLTQEAFQALADSAGDTPADPVPPGPLFGPVPPPGPGAGL